MQAVVTSARVPIKLWGPVAEVESSALEQLMCERLTTETEGRSK
jgi:hypothetical protein